MTEREIKIKALSRSFGTALINSGFGMIKSSYKNLLVVHFPFSHLKDAFDKVVKIPLIQMDYTYYFTTWKNWDKMLDIIWGIIKNFKWEEDKFDCDNRAKLVSSLCSLFFGMNSCGEVYCKITNIKTGASIRHWTNVIVTATGELYLFDVDNSGLRMKLVPGKPITMGRWHYEFRSARFS